MRRGLQLILFIVLMCVPLFAMAQPEPPEPPVKPEPPERPESPQEPDWQESEPENPDRQNAEPPTQSAKSATPGAGDLMLGVGIGGPVAVDFRFTVIAHESIELSARGGLVFGGALDVTEPGFYAMIGWAAGAEAAWLHWWGDDALVVALDVSVIGRAGFGCLLSDPPQCDPMFGVFGGGGVGWTRRWERFRLQILAEFHALDWIPRPSENEVEEQTRSLLGLSIRMLWAL